MVYGSLRRRPNDPVGFQRHNSVEVTRMKLTSLALLAALAVVPATVVACGGSVEAPQTAAGATKAPVGTNTHGFVKVAGEALGEVPLRTEQRTELEKIATEADQRHAAMADGRKDLANTIADQIEKGTI